MKRLTFFFVIVMFSVSLTAQKGNPSNTEREIEYRLANTRYNEQNNAEAGELYYKLFKKHNQQHYLNQYVDCMIRIGEYGKAEKVLKDYTKKNKTAWRPIADLVYAYTINNKKSDADKVVNEIVKNLPPNKNAILSISSALWMRNQYDQSIKILEKASSQQVDSYNYYPELANAYQNTGNYEQCFDYYLKYIELSPEQFENIKSRIQVILLNDTRGDVSDLFRKTLLRRQQKNPKDNTSAEMLVWLSLQEQDYELALDQCISLDKRLGDYENKIIDLANITSNNRQYATAERGYKYIAEKKENNVFYNEAIVGYLNAKYHKLESEHGKKANYDNLANEIQAALNALPAYLHPLLVNTLASIQAYHSNNPSEAEKLLQNTLDNYDLSRNDIAIIKMLLADIKLAKNDVWEATLLYSQVDKSMKEEPVGHEARFRNAQLRYFIGEFAWAESQLKILKAATSKLIANDAMSLSLVIKDNLEADTTGNELRRIARADFDIYRHDNISAIATLDSIIENGNNVSKPHAMFKKAEILNQQNNIEQAVKLYDDIYTLFPNSYIADDAIMSNASMAVKKNDIEKAKSLYETIIIEYPTSIYTTEAKRSYRNIQNKTPNESR